MGFHGRLSTGLCDPNRPQSQVRGIGSMDRHWNCAGQCKLDPLVKQKKTKNKRSGKGNLKHAGVKQSLGKDDGFSKCIPIQTYSRLQTKTETQNVMYD